MATQAELKEKWKPITRWIPQYQSAQIQVMAEENVWVPLDRMCSHVGIETGYTGDPNIKSRGTNRPSGNCTQTGACAPDLRAHGLFQIWFPGFIVDWNRIHDPAYNSYCGAKTLALKYKQCGRNWRAASAAFFAGSCVDINIIDTSTGTSQADYDAAMTRNMQELNSIGIGQGTTDPKAKIPTNNGDTNTTTDKPSSEKPSSQCITILGQELCAPSTGEIVSQLVEQNFPRFILILVGIAVLFVGIKAIT